MDGGEVGEVGEVSDEYSYFDEERENDGIGMGGFRIWNGRKVRLGKKDEYIPLLQILNEESERIVLCKDKGKDRGKNKVKVVGEVSREDKCDKQTDKKEKETKGNIGVIVEHQSEDGRSKIRAGGNVDSKGNISGKIEGEWDF